MRGLRLAALVAQLCLAAASMERLFNLIDADASGTLDMEEARVLVALNFEVDPSEVTDEVVRGGKSGPMDAAGISFVGAGYEKFTELLDGADAEAFEQVLAAASARKDL